MTFSQRLLANKADKLKLYGLGPLDCGDCRLCCEGEDIPILEGDNSHQWEVKFTRRSPAYPRGLALATTEGRCAYLTQAGCGIHDKPRPVACVHLDCRVYALDRQGKGSNPQMQRVIDQGLKKIAEERR